MGEGFRSKAAPQIVGPLLFGAEAQSFGVVPSCLERVSGEALGFDLEFRLHGLELGWSGA